MELHHYSTWDFHAIVIDVIFAPYRVFCICIASDVLGEVFSYPDPLPSLEPAEIKVICPKHKWLEA